MFRFFIQLKLQQMYCILSFCTSKLFSSQPPKSQNKNKYLNYDKLLLQLFNQNSFSAYQKLYTVFRVKKSLQRPSNKHSVTHQN